MSEINSHVILSYIDTPSRIFLWSADQVFACLFPLATGLLLDHFFLGIVVSCFVPFGFKLFRKRFGEGKLNSILYWHFPTPNKFVERGLPPSYVRLWIK